MDEFKKGDIVKFMHGCDWLYGVVDEVYEDSCDINYSSNANQSKYLLGPANLDGFCNVEKSKLIKVTLEFGNTKSLIK